MLSRILLVALVLISTAASAQTVQLVTADEARQPAVAAKPGSRAITRGPGVKLTSPESVSGNFPFQVEFTPRGGSTIDVASVKVEYLRGPGVDLTSRLKASTSARGISVAAAAAPAGEHSFHVSVRDSEGREGHADFKLMVK